MHSFYDISLRLPRNLREYANQAYETAQRQMQEQVIRELHKQITAERKEQARG